MASTFGLLRESLTNKSPVPFTGKRSFLPSFTANDKGGQLDAMTATGTMFAITSRLAESVAQVEWKLFRKRTDSRRVYHWDSMDDRKEVVDHWALRVWNNPNPFMTRQEFVETVQMHYELTGEEWWTVGYNPGITIPMELWPVRPDRMQVVPHPEDFLSGYVYQSPDGRQIPLGVKDVILVRRPHPKDPYRGISPVSALAADLDAAHYSALWNRNFFRNSAEPGGIIKVPKRLSESDFQRLKMQWDSSHRGVANSHRVAILEGEGYEWIDRKLSQRDMQFVELRGITREMIREAYAFPKPMLGTVEDVNRANAEAAEVVFARWLLVSRLEKMKQALNHDFLPLFGSAGEGIEFDYVSPVPDDREADNAELTAKVTAYQTLMNAGGVDGEAVLEFLGLPAELYKEPEPVPVLLSAAPPAVDPNMPEEGMNDA